jgi:endonuclease/exonuclease/phosphatase family metal-dependent hydrolase
VKPFRILQFNMQFGQIWHAHDPDHAPIRLDDTIAEIRSHEADIIHLQEVEHARSDAHQNAENFERLRAALPGYHAHFAFPRPDPRELPFGIGLAIFSRTPLTATFAEDLPSPPIEFNFCGETKTPTDRLLIGARTTVAGREIALLNTHLLAFFMLKTDSRTHPGQRRRIAEHLRAAGTTPTLLTGDFNVRDHVGLAGEFAAEGFTTAQTSAVTWHRMPYVLDHIFYNAPLRCVAAKVVPSLASDHLPVVADFVWA